MISSCIKIHTDGPQEFPVHMELTFNKRMWNIILYVVEKKLYATIITAACFITLLVNK